MKPHRYQCPTTHRNDPTANITTGSAWPLFEPASKSKFSDKRYVNIMGIRMSVTCKRIAHTIHITPYATVYACKHTTRQTSIGPWEACMCHTNAQKAITRACTTRHRYRIVCERNPLQYVFSPCPHGCIDPTHPIRIHSKMQPEREPMGRRLANSAHAKCRRKSRSKPAAPT